MSEDYRNELERYAKCRAYKDKVNPDGRVSLCGEPVQHDEDGREFFEIPAHQREYLMKQFPAYEFSQVYQKVKPEDKAPEKIILEKAPPPKKGKAATEVEDPLDVL